MKDRPSYAKNVIPKFKYMKFYIFTSHIGKLLWRIETELISKVANSAKIVVAPFTHTSLSLQTLVSRVKVAIDS